MTGSESAGRYQEGEPESHGSDTKEEGLREAMLSWAILNRASLRLARLANVWTDSAQWPQANYLVGSVFPDGEQQAETPASIPATDQ